MEENKVIEVVAEEVTLENEIQQELVKANVTDTVIARLKEEYGELRLASLDDKEGYLTIKAAAKDCSKLRNLAVKICKEGRDHAVKIQKKWVAKEKEVVGKIAEVEDVLDAEIKRFDDEVDRKVEAEKKRVEEAYMARTQELTKMGAVYLNAEFSLGNFSIEGSLVKECSQEVWESEMFPKFHEQHQIVEAARIEEQKKKEAEEAGKRRQQEEFEAKQREFAEQQAAFKKQQEEAERAEKERQLVEQKQRMETNNKRLHLLLPFNPYTKGIDTNNLWNLDESAFIDLLNDTKIKHEQEEEAKKVAMQEEVAAKERVKIEEENRKAELQRQQDEARKAEELAKAGDKANWDAFMDEISGIQPITVKSGQYRKVYALAMAKIEEIKALKP